MRKLKLQVQISVDGFIAGPNNEMDWMVWNWDDKLKHYVGALTEPIGCIVLGRKLAQGFIPHWKSNPEQEGATKFNSTKKVVFTKTLTTSEWENTALAKGELVDEINKLKNEPGGDIIAYGGGSFVSSLIKHRLIDEFHLFVNPSVLGNGMPIFKELTDKQNLTLIKASPFDCGIVVLHYQLKQN
jgi:dihydrofolate reductase